MNVHHLGRSLALSLVLAAAGAGAQSVEVSVAPPRPPTEARPPAPANDQVWVPGYYAWNGTRHVWNSGQWQRPPHALQTWMEPEWIQHGPRYVFVPGRWVDANTTNIMPAASPNVVPTTPRSAPAAMPMMAPARVMRGPSMPMVTPSGARIVPAPVGLVETNIAPPPPRVERRLRVGRAQVWVPGFYSWNGSGYVWNLGRLEALPHGYSAWVAPNWTRHDHRWILTQGHWR